MQEIYIYICMYKNPFLRDLNRQLDPGLEYKVFATSVNS